MIRWFLILCVVLSITACSSSHNDQTASTPVAPTIVAPADPPDILAFTDDVEPLNVSAWDIEDVRAHMSTLRTRPHTLRSTGPSTDVIEIVDGDARITTQGTNVADSATLGDFTIRVADGQEWVRYGHVRAGTIAMQGFAVATAGLDIDELLADPDMVDEAIVQRFLLQRSFFAETAPLETMWVPYERNEESIFLASMLDRTAVDGLIDGALAAIVDEDVTVTEEAIVVPLAASSQFAVLTIPLDRSPAEFSTGDDWSLTIEPGVTNIDSIGAPAANDVITRDVLLASTAVEGSCIAATIEATLLVEDGALTCDQPQSLPRTKTVGADE